MYRSQQNIGTIAVPRPNGNNERPYFSLSARLLETAPPRPLPLPHRFFRTFFDRASTPPPLVLYASTELGTNAGGDKQAAPSLTTDAVLGREPLQYLNFIGGDIPPRCCLAARRSRSGRNGNNALSRPSLVAGVVGAATAEAGASPHDGEGTRRGKKTGVLLPFRTHGRGWCRQNC